ncbi:MAG: hypothetical protein WCH34_02010 [Bacteroidota bacterium]
MEKQLFINELTESLKIDNKSAEQIINSFYYERERSVQINLPSHDIQTTGFMTVNQMGHSGKTIKIKNAFLNMKKLLIDSAEIALTISEVIATPYFIPLAALIIWNKAYSNIKIDLDQNHAIAIKLMWENRDIEKDWINENKAFDLFNQNRKERNQNSYILDDFITILTDLDKMQCIKKISSDIWLIEEVKIK